MSDHDGQNIEASVLERQKAERHIQGMKPKIEVLRRKVEEQKLRAKRDALHAEVARGAERGRSGQATARDSTSSPAVPTSGLAAQPGMSQLSLSPPNWSQLKPPKFDNVKAHFRMWRSKFQALLSSDNPAMVGEIIVSQKELEQRQTDRDC